MYVDGTDAETHGYAITQNTFLKQLQSCAFFPCYHTSAPYTVEYGRRRRAKCGAWSVESGV